MIAVARTTGIGQLRSNEVHNLTTLVNESEFTLESIELLQVPLYNIAQQWLNVSGLASASISSIEQSDGWDWYATGSGLSLQEADGQWWIWTPDDESDESIREIILSGGDPLVLTDSAIERLVERLDRIPHLQRLRIHSRLPIVIPSRVTDGLLSTLRTSRLTPVVVVHSNHPAELDTATGEALRRFINAGIPVLNQAVLLKGVNDNADVLTELSERLVNLAAMPYYLHQLDPVTGSLHFQIPVERGLELIAALRRRLPGYAVPRYVQEIPGEAHKSDLIGLPPELEKEN